MESTVKERVIELIKSKKISIREFERLCNLSNGYVKGIKHSILPDKMRGITLQFPDINPIWLLTGDGEMLRTLKSGMTYAGGESKENGNLIPFYDNVSSIGGVNELGANMDSVSQPTDYIDTGDWFRDATSAIRHYGESMTEYPQGCILALKEVYNRELTIPGRDYVIETSEYRVTKRIQRGNDSEHITAYSTNPETYADGRLIHEPFDIPWSEIIRISLVLGYVVKKNGGTMIFNNQKSR